MTSSSESLNPWQIGDYTPVFQGLNLPTQAKRDGDKGSGTVNPGCQRRENLLKLVCGR